MLFVNSLEKFGHALRCNRKCRRHKKCVVNYIYFFLYFLKNVKLIQGINVSLHLQLRFTVLAPTRENVS